MEKRFKVALPLILILAILIGIVAISINYLYNAVRAFGSANSNDALYYALLGGTGIGISLYLLYAIRKKTISQKPPPKVITITECKKCGFKSLRTFAKGDYIFKSVGNCQKCNEPMLITSIYAEKTKK